MGGVGLGGRFVESRSDRRAAAAKMSLSAVLESLRQRMHPQVSRKDTRHSGGALTEGSLQIKVAGDEGSQYRGKHNRGSHGCTSSLALLGSGKATSRRSSTSSRR